MAESTLDGRLKTDDSGMGLRTDGIVKGRWTKPFPFFIGLLGYHYHPCRVVAAGGHGAQAMRTGSSYQLDVANSLGKTQLHSDILPVVQPVKKSKAKLNQISANEASNAATACDVFDALFPGRYSNKTSSDYTAEVEQPMYVLEQ